MVKLLTMCGYPGSGKSDLSKAISERFGFRRLGYDDISAEMFGKTPYFLTDEQNYAVWKEYSSRRNETLRKGNTVLDITSLNEDTRCYLMWHEMPKDTRSAQRCLLWLKAHPEVLESRLVARGWGEGTTERWKNRFGWEDPEPDSRNYILLGPYDNNTSGDADHILEALKGQL